MSNQNKYDKKKVTKKNILLIPYEMIEFKDIKNMKNK